MNYYRLMAVTFIVALSGVLCDMAVSIIKRDVSSAMFALGIFAIGIFAISKNSFVREELKDIWLLVRKGRK